MILHLPACRFEPVSNLISAQLVGGGAVEYTNCIFVEGKDPHHNKCPGDNTKQSDGEDLVMLELWVMQSTRLSPLVHGPL